MRDEFEATREGPDDDSVAEVFSHLAETVRSVYHIAMSGHRGHRRCLCDSPAYLGRPDPLCFKWIGRQFE